MSDLCTAGTPTHPRRDEARRAELVGGQWPYAAVLACADSRVPPEVVFNEGPGDLFVVRSAGPVLDDAVVASLRYAVRRLGVPPVLVLGHARCGAVAAYGGEAGTMGTAGATGAVFSG